MRAQRRRLTPLQVTRASQRLATHLARHPYVTQAKNVALYIGFDHELDPWQFRQHWQGNKRLFLPILAPLRHGHLLFFPATPPWQHNRYGIREPMPHQSPIHPAQLDIILLPLTAFDSHGGRLGMGGGFYDRTLARQTSWSKRPRCIGIGYRFQEQKYLPLMPWDQPLDAVVTD